MATTSSAAVSGAVAVAVGRTSGVLVGSGQAGSVAGAPLFVCVAAVAGLAGGSLSTLPMTSGEGLLIGGLAVTDETCSVSALS